METVRHDSDGYVTGFDRLNIDPQATKQRVERELAEAGFVKAVKDAQQEIADAEDFRTEKAAKAKLVEALALYRAEWEYLYERCTMYFQPRAGEVVLPSDEVATLRERFAALGSGQKLTIEGGVIDAGESG